MRRPSERATVEKLSGYAEDADDIFRMRIQLPESPDGPSLVWIEVSCAGDEVPIIRKWARTATIRSDLPFPELNPGDPTYRWTKRAYANAEVVEREGRVGLRRRRGSR